jgi:hypothetical protein
MANGLLKYSAGEAANLQLGQAGYDIVAGGENVTGIYVAITVLVGSEVIADNTASGTVTAVSVDTDMWESLSTQEIPEGVTIYGRWNSITMGSSDECIAYKG